MVVMSESSEHRRCSLETCGERVKFRSGARTSGPQSPDVHVRRPWYSTSRPTGGRPTADRRSALHYNRASMTLDEQIDFLAKGTVDLIERNDLKSKIARGKPPT